MNKPVSLQLKGAKWAALLKPVWSKQHGAYISLITFWIIAVIISGGPEIFHLAALVLLLAGFNATELTINSIKRKSPVPLKHKLWLGLYPAIALLAGAIVGSRQQWLIYAIPIFAAAGVVMLLLTLKRNHKGASVEIATFALLSAAAFLSVIPGGQVFTPVALFAWGLLLAYSGMTVYFVKFTLKKTGPLPAILFFLISGAVLLHLCMLPALTLAVLVLMLVKLVAIVFLPGKMRQVKVQQLGLLETGFQLLLIGCFIWLA